MFTAIIVLKLADMGLLDLAASIVKIESSEFHLGITIRHLLTHTSGMPDYYDEDLIEDFDTFELEVPVQKLISPHDYLPMFLRGKMNFEPGQKFKYCNGGFVYLAMIIEKVSGQSYKKCIEDFILTPLGLKRTGVYPFNGLPINTAFGYFEENGRWFTNIYKLPIQAGGDGGLYTTKDDMLAVWKGLHEGKLFSMDLVSEMFKRHAVINEKLNLYYGLGVYLRFNEENVLSFIIGGDAGVSFRSAYRHDTNDYLFAVSNRSHDIWDLSDELVEIQMQFLT